jgi:hypothetical protein
MKAISAFISAATALACIAFMQGCFNDNPVSSEGVGAIAGKVLPLTGNATVYLEQGRPIDSTTADPSDGYFRLSGLHPGTYRVRIAAAGYDTFSAFITVEPDFSYEFGCIILAARSNYFDDSIPSVYDHYPSDNAEVIYLPPDKYGQGSGRLYISVSFDRPMDRESVERALSITPPVTGGYFEWFQNTRTFSYQAGGTSYIWDGRVLYDSLSVSESRMASDMAPAAGAVPSAAITSYSVVKSFTFYFPRSQCFTDTTYTIRISRNAVDTAGAPLDSALEFSFKTIQSAISYQGIQMLPHNGDDWVALITDGIKLTFPGRMDETSTEAAIAVNLCARPIFLWQDYNHLTIYTGGIFVPDTLYAVTIGSAALDLDGKPLGTADTLSFRTAPIQITQSDPQRGKIGFPPGNSLTLTFNTFMDRTSFASCCVLVSDSGDTVRGSYAYVAYANYNSTRGTYDTTYVLNQIRFAPVTSLKRNMFHQYTIGAGVKDLDGYPLKESYAIPFITAP